MTRKPGMSRREFAAAIEAIGLSQARAGDFLGFSPRQSRRYIAGEADVPVAAAKLLRMMLAMGLSVEDVESWVNKR